MKYETDMKMTTTEDEQIFSPLQLHEKVLDKIKNILEVAGIPTDQEIIVKEVKGEDSNSVFRIDCGHVSYALKVFSDALKVFSDSKEFGQFYTNKIFNELLIDNSIPTPKIIYSNNNLEILPAPFIMWEWFPGEPSCDLESKSERRNIAIQTGRQLRKTHEIKTLGFGRPGAKNEWSGGNIKWTIDFFVKRIQNLIEKGGTAFSDQELMDILKMTAESEELLSFTEPYLLHGDITGGNVLVSDSEDITFIDPGEIIAGDPMSDLGYSQITRLSPIFREGIWEGYTKNQPLTEEENSRFLRWRLLRQCVIACKAVSNNDKNAENYVNDAKMFLEELKKYNSPE